ncbi:MAG TPA: OmpA family protein, partial [Gemmatimonadaceae bacterium]|nr:OmpA family protein [Gemmatimonadaceae bacterium]
LYDIRIAASQTSLFDALNASGRVATHGILFATNSATIEPGSDSTLKEIGDMLTQHADLKLMIEGHTDNVGSAAANQTLSEQRAAAVKTYLVTTYHVDAGRLQTKGYGDTKPVASNSTPDGRQQNRRVELVKM